MLKTIKEFCEEGNIELPTDIELSKIYVDIHSKYMKDLKEWETVESDGSILKHYVWMYNVKDLKEYFKK